MENVDSRTEGAGLPANQGKARSTRPAVAQTIENVLIAGDLSQLTAEQRVTYYQAVCKSVGLNPLTKPFDYLHLNGKLVLYAKRDATDQVRKIHGVSLTIVGREMVGEVYIVTARAKMGERDDESTGCVHVPQNLRGDMRANAYMKAETKAKRRVTLSIVGLGMLDETEVDSVPQEAKRPPAELQKPPKLKDRGMAPTGTRFATWKQLGFLHGEAEKRKWKIDDGYPLKALIYVLYGYESTKQLDMSQFDEVLKILQEETLESWITSFTHEQYDNYMKFRDKFAELHSPQSASQADPPAAGPAKTTAEKGNAEGEERTGGEASEETPGQP